MRKFLSLLNNRSGAVTIEFALTLCAFFFLVLFIAETARLSYISSVLDLAVSEAAKEAKNAPANNERVGTYRSRFEKRLITQGGLLWGFLTRENAVEINIGYAASITEMINTGGGDRFEKRPIARYQLKYRYKPMFFPFPSYWVSHVLNREVIFVQEYERSEFT
ncbi:TadE/TadG family type IV pilus assembly protein [Erwinia tasmaniensis]|uniref:TadE/TadG family type IV pilus assembly protein n=1 Tax=Erwinia tasmaniensis TaxID=338565 RepID=UPI003A4D8577